MPRGRGQKTASPEGFNTMVCDMDEMMDRNEEEKMQNASVNCFEFKDGLKK